MSEQSGGSLRPYIIRVPRAGSDGEDADFGCSALHVGVLQIRRAAFHPVDLRTQKSSSKGIGR